MKFIKKYYLFSLFTSADFTRGIHLAYILDLGFGNNITGILQMILFVSSLFFEIPSGFFADRYKRKYSLIAGSICFILSALIYLNSQSLFLVSVLYGLQGLGFAFYSGANQALLFAKVEESQKTKDKYYHFLAKARMISTYTLTFSVLIGGWLVKLGYNYVFIAFLIVNLIALIIASSFKERSQELSKNDKIKLNDFKNILIDNRQNLLLIFGVALIESIHTPYFVFFQNFLKYNKVDTSIISSIIFFIMLTGAISYKLSDKLKKITLQKLLKFTNIVLIVCLLTHLINFPWYFYVLIFLIINIVPNLLFVFTDDYLSSIVEDKVRATFLSIVSFINSILIALTYLYLGYSYDKFGGDLTTASMVVPAIFSFLFITTYFNKFKKNV